MMMEIHIVIIAKHGPAALSCIRSLGRKQIAVSMVCIDSNQGKPPCSKYLEKSLLMSKINLFSDIGITLIAQFVEDQKAQALLAIDENISAWLVANRQRFPQTLGIYGLSRETLDSVRSKVNQIAVATKVGMTVLPTALVDKENVNTVSIDPNYFPLCLRPSIAGSVSPMFKAMIVRNRTGLNEKIEKMSYINAPVICQPFLSLPNLVVHGARTKLGGHSALQAFLVEHKFEGVTLVIEPFEVAPDLLGKCMRFTDEFDIIGNYHFEFLFDPLSGNAYFLEINCRFGGTTAKVCACGYDEPMVGLMAYRGQTVTGFTLKKVKCSSRQALIKYMVFAMRHKLSWLDFPKCRPIDSIKMALKAFFLYKDDVWSAHDDLRGSADLYWSNFKELFRSTERPSPR